MDPLSQLLLQRASQPPTQGVPPAPAPPMGAPPSGIQSMMGPTGPNQMGGPLSGPNLANPHAMSVAGPPGFSTPSATTAGPQAAQDTVPPSGMPETPPNPTHRIPQAVQRFQNANAIQDAYRGGWAPNPVLLQASLVGK
jgi:hypothetical protein